ncbi:MAG: DinB family protein [Thermomicrobiales bacterium]
MLATIADCGRLLMREGMPMATVAVDQLRCLMDEAFEGKGKDWHSLLRNLRSAPAESWRWVPPGGVRSIADLAQHVGACKFMCENHTFGDASLRWEHSLVVGNEALADADSAIAWLREGHERLRRGLASLDDAELARPRPTYWGVPRETWWTLSVMIQHDLYHSGEINHIRALFQRDDC